MQWDGLVLNLYIYVYDVCIEYVRLLQERFTGLILGLRPANERRRYYVTTSLTGSVHA